MALPQPAFWQGRRVFLTGHTGFKGGWLALWLERLGAAVEGYALAPESSPSTFEELGVARHLGRSRIADVRDRDELLRAVAAARPEVVFHLAAQPLVLRGYQQPVETFATNVMGTVHLLEAVRQVGSAKAVVVVTTDKVYAENDDDAPFREGDRLGGVEPYGGSKAAAEIVVETYRAAYFAAAGVALASARAGNVIGGGDESEARLVPDVVRALRAGQTLTLRNPSATRPWQHVLDPLAGYLVLAEHLFGAGAERYARAWNFGPGSACVATVEDVVARVQGAWGQRVPSVRSDGPREASRLALDASAATAELGWIPRLGLDEAIDWTVAWYRRVHDGESGERLALDQLERYTASATAAR
ncbi:MAG: CDP-glucose 4,6-dehydratase [Vulcanimicrobiaceae bacterium]|jgi:CDP-glucose 4,6-dehydratase